MTRLGAVAHRFRRVGQIVAVVVLLAVPFYGWRLIDDLRTDTCISRRDARDAILGWMDRHGGIDPVDRAEFDRLNFEVIPCP